MKVYAGSYTGNGTAQSITGPQWQPDFILVKRVGASNGIMHSSAMTANVSRHIAGTTNSVAGAITSIISTGFNVGADASVNTNNDVYHYLCLQAAAADCKVSSYPGDGNDNHNITGVGFQADLLVIWNVTNSVRVHFKTSDMAGDTAAPFDTNSGAVANLIQALAADGFQVGTSGHTNASGATYYYLAVKNAAGVAKAFTYTGSAAADNRSVTVETGLQPVFAFIKDGASTPVAYMRFVNEAGDHSWPLAGASSRGPNWKRPCRTSRGLSRGQSWRCPTRLQPWVATERN